MSADQLWAIVGATEIAWALQIRYLRLSRKYTWLTIYLLASGTQSMVSSGLIGTAGWPSAAFSWMWTFSQPVIWLLMLLLLFEAYAHALGLERIGPIASIGIAAAAIGLMFLSAFFVLGESGFRNFMVRQEGSVYLVLVILCVILMGGRPRNEFGKNEKAIFVIFTLVCLFQAGFVELRELIGWEAYRELRYAFMPGFLSALMCAGIAVFSSGGRGAMGPR